MNKLKEQIQGFTLIELILVIGVFSLIFSSATVVFGDMIGRNSLKYHGYQLVQNMREARMNSIVQKNDSSWGIRFDTGSSPHGYTFYKGSSYLFRDPAYDLDFEFPAVVSISQLNLGGGQEVSFLKSSGSPSVTGGLTLATDIETYSVSINSLGLVDFNF